MFCSFRPEHRKAPNNIPIFFQDKTPYANQLKKLSVQHGNIPCTCAISAIAYRYIVLMQQDIQHIYALAFTSHLFIIVFFQILLIEIFFELFK